MTEYDYSPGAYQRYVEHLGKVADWVADTNSCSRLWSNPFVPSPTIRKTDFYNSPDDGWEHVTFTDLRGRSSQSRRKPAVDPRAHVKHPTAPNPTPIYSQQRTTHHRIYTTPTVPQPQPQSYTQHKSRRSQSVPVAHPAQPPRYSPDVYPYPSYPHTRRNTLPTRHTYPVDTRYVDPPSRPTYSTYPYRAPHDPADQFHRAHSRSPDKVQPQPRYTVPHADHRRGVSGQTYHTPPRQARKPSPAQHNPSLFKRLYEGYKRNVLGPKHPWPSQAYY